MARLFSALIGRDVPVESMSWKSVGNGNHAFVLSAEPARRWSTSLWWRTTEHPARERSFVQPAGARTTPNSTAVTTV